VHTERSKGRRTCQCRLLSENPNIRAQQARQIVPELRLEKGGGAYFSIISLTQGVSPYVHHDPYTKIRFRYSRSIFGFPAGIESQAEFIRGHPVSDVNSEVEVGDPSRSPASPVQSVAKCKVRFRQIETESRIVSGIECESHPTTGQIRF
jgi:hypothetical protein